MVTSVQDGGNPDDTRQKKVNRSIFQEELVVLLDLSTVGANFGIVLVDVQNSSSHVARKQVLDVHRSLAGCL